MDAATYSGIPYSGALILAPIMVGVFGIVIERLLISRLYHLDHLYGLLLTFGLVLIIEGLFRREFGSSGLPYTNPIPGARTWASCSSPGIAPGLLGFRC